MWHKAIWKGQPMRLELTRVGLLVELANHYTTRGALSPSVYNNISSSQKWRQILSFCQFMIKTLSFIGDRINIVNYHLHVMPLGWISLTLSHHSSLSSITSALSSRLHPVSVQSSRWSSNTWTSLWRGP